MYLSSRYSGPTDVSPIEELPDEILFGIFLLLDIPELHALSLV
jgi:hypothetical protein